MVKIGDCVAGYVLWLRLKPKSIKGWREQKCKFSYNLLAGAGVTNVGYCVDKY